MITSLAKGRTFTKLIRLYLFITAKLKVKYYRQFFFFYPSAEILYITMQYYLFNVSLCVRVVWFDLVPSKLID